MWSQTSISAPWTKQELLDTLIDIFTSANAGYTLHDDTRLGSFIAVFRSNLGIGKDYCLRVALTDISGGVRQTWHAFETADYNIGTGNLPANILAPGYHNHQFGINLLLNVAVSPDKNVFAFWYKQGVTVTDPVVISTISPFMSSDGITPVNAGDDGTGFPQFGMFEMYQSGNVMALQQSSSQSSDVGIGVPAQNFSWLGSRFFATRTPLNRPYFVRTVEGLSAMATNSGDKLLARYPHQRCSAWAGSGVLSEGFRPAISSQQIISNLLTVDNRGHLAPDGDLLIADNFGGAPEDAFTVGANQYRIVCSFNLPINYFSQVALWSLAVRVA